MSVLAFFRKKRDIPRKSGYLIGGENNQIQLIENGKVTLLPINETISGLSVRVTGKNNVIKLHKPFKFINSVISFDCQDSTVEIKENSVCNTLVVLNNGGFENRNLYIGKNFACWGCEILLNGRQNSVYIGDDCMFSKEIHIMSGDGHRIIPVGGGT